MVRPLRGGSSNVPMTTKLDGGGGWPLPVVEELFLRLPLVTLLNRKIELLGWDHWRIRQYNTWKDVRSDVHLVCSWTQISVSLCWRSSSGMSSMVVTRRGSTGVQGAPRGYCNHVISITRLLKLQFLYSLTIFKWSTTFMQHIQFP